MTDQTSSETPGPALDARIAAVFDPDTDWSHLRPTEAQTQEAHDALVRRGLLPQEGPGVDR